MNRTILSLCCRANLLVLAFFVSSACYEAKAALTILGTQYQPDYYFPEFNCYWNASAYPGPCRTPIQGATLHVYLKNTGASAVTVSDVNLTTASATYSLTRIIKMANGSYNPKLQTSIYFYWDNPPADVIAAGEPVWYRFDPPTIAPGKVGQVAVRMRYLPATPTVTLSVVSTAGTVTTDITVDADVPRVASIGYSDDLRKVYLHWRRSGGAAPTSIWLDGTDVTASTTTVSDPTVNFGTSVVSLSNPLTFFSYHVFQGFFSDGKVAAASQRAWTNKFIYATYSAFDDYTGAQWVAEASDHGFNNVQMNLGIMGSYLGTVSGRNDCVAHGYGYTIGGKDKLNALDPDMWFLNDEPDAQENNQSNTHCRDDGARIPCDSDHWIGTLMITNVNIYGQLELRKARPNVPFTVNLDGGLEPESFFTWGPAVDILQTDNYYEPRLKDAYLSYPNRIPLFRDAKVSYAVARTACAGAEPNPSNHLLYSTKQPSGPWPYPTPESKRFEAYYSLAGGSKGMGYWWLNPPNGLNSSQECAALWKEMGLVGNEIKTARPLLVISTPVDLTLTPSANVWARALASGANTLILLAVNDNYYNDIAGCHYTAVPNASLTATLPSWMQSSPTAFEITAGGLRDVSTVLNGSQLQVNLGTLTLTKMIVVTTDPALRSSIQTRYDTQVKAHVCNFAQELCVNTPPTIAQQPINQTVAPGGTAHFTLVAGGTSPLSYRWQKNNVNLSDGGHYSGCTTITLTIITADPVADAASYRCIVTNAYGTVTSSSATLTVVEQPPAIMEQPSDETVPVGGIVTFTVTASGSEPLTYQWQKNNGNLSDGGHYTGTTTPALVITDADGTDEASYRCVVSNDYGSTNSDSAALTIDWCIPSVLLGHGDMEDTSSYSVCPDWESYTAGFNSDKASWGKETSTVHGGAASQRCRIQSSGAGSLVGVRQTFDANVGDAFTFEGWVNPVSNPAAGQQVAMVVNWDGSTANPVTGSGSWKISTGSRNVWTHLQNLAGNATDTEVTLFLDSRRTVSSQDLAAYWDDVVAYRAYVPLEPLVGSAGSTALNVQLRPDCNSGNSAAQFAISIGGGAYTLGTHWVQANGSVGTAEVWQSAATWGAKTVTGLDTGTLYGFAARARYSSTLTQPTSLGTSATGTTTGSQPPAITQQPAAQNVCLGSSATFHVAASGSGTINYQWQKNSANLANGGHYSGVTTATLTVSTVDANDVANYRCMVSDSGGSTNSSEAGLALKAFTIITTPPSGQSVPAGANAIFSVTAVGDGTLTYQWQTNGVNISDGSHYAGCTTATLTVNNVSSADAVSYRCRVTGGCGVATSSDASLTLTTTPGGSFSLSAVPLLPGDTANEARAITPDGQWVVGVSGTRGFLHAVNTANVISALSSDSAQATLLTGVGFRTNSGQRQIVMAGLSGSSFGAWMTADGGATWGALAGTSTGKKPTVPLANAVAGTASDVFYAIWSDQGTGASDNWALNVGRFSNTWPATVAWGPKSVPQPDTTQVNGVSSNGRAVGWRRSGSTLVYANYVADWQGHATPAMWNFNGLDGTTAGQAMAVSADGTTIFGISPKGAATGATNYAYKARFNTAFPGAATQLSIAQLPNFPDSAGATDLAVPYGCSPDGRYVVGMCWRGVEKAVLWDTAASNPSQWSVVDLTEVATANGILGGFTRLSRAYSIGTDSAGKLVIAGAGLDATANARAFLLTVSPPVAPIGFPPVLNAFGLSPDGFSCEFMTLANPAIIYYLDCTTNLAPPSTWTTISSAPGSGGITSLSDANPSGQQRFYRIRVQ